MIYIASPYSHKDKQVEELRFKAVASYIGKLTSNGLITFSPIVYGHTLLSFHPLPTDWEFWKNFCESFLYKCDELYVLKMDGWDLSTGVQNEIKLALELKMKITYIDLLDF